MPGAQPRRPAVRLMFPSRQHARLSLALAATLGLGSLWQLSEQDIFWQVRAGTELWQTASFPEVDSWSFSARGAPWRNVQWLTTLLFAATYHLGDVAALIGLRGLLVAALMAVLGSCIDTVLHRLQPRAAHARWHAASLVLLLYVALLPRLQLRADLLVLLLAGGLSRLALTPPRPARQPWFWGAAVLLAANLHAGTAPFVCALALAFASDATLRSPLAAAARARLLLGRLLLLGTCLWATPYGLRVLPLLWQHLRYFSHHRLFNPDHQRLGWAYLWPEAPVGTPWTTIVGHRGIGLAALALLLLAAAARPGRAALPGYAARLPRWGTTALLAALSVDRVRALPYLLVYATPAMALGLAARPGLWRRQLPPWLATAATAALAACSSLALQPSRGWTVNAATFPVRSSAFIAAERPQGNILHTAAFGAYTVWALRAYPDYVDTRETPFWGLQDEILASYASAAFSQQLYRTYDVQTVLMPIPNTQYLPERGFDDVMARYLPPEAWALVYIDRLAFVAVRRIPAHAALIAAHEYQLLRPNLPANAYPMRTTRTTATDARFTAELQRCRRESPESAYCLMAEVAWWQRQQDPRYDSQAVEQLRSALSLLPPRCPQQRLTGLVALQSALRGRGDLAAAAAVEPLLGTAFTP